MFISRTQTPQHKHIKETEDVSQRILNLDTRS